MGEGGGELWGKGCSEGDVGKGEGGAGTGERDVVRVMWGRRGGGGGGAVGKGGDCGERDVVRVMWGRGRGCRDCEERDAQKVN